MTNFLGSTLSCRRAGVALAAACSWFIHGALHAEPIPFGRQTSEITAREQPIAGFLQDLLGGISVRVVVSPSVKGAVNGHFSGSTEKVYRNIARAFNLVEYYDGSVLYVYTPQDMVTRALPVDSTVSARLRRAVEEIGMLDERNKVRISSEGSLVASGTRRFVEQIEEMARAEAQGHKADTANQPSGFRVFYLRYAWAQDVTMNFSGRQVMLPGVASTVRAMMTNNSKSQVAATPYEQAPRNTVPRARASGSGRQATLGSPGADSQQASGPVLTAASGSNAQLAGAASAPAVDGGGAAAVLIDAQQVRVEADARLNAVLVRDAPERMPIYEHLISALDVEPQAVEIEATIIDVNTEKLRELGINWRYTTGRSSLLFGRGDSSDLALTPVTPVGAITPPGAGGYISAVLGSASQFIARIHALQEQGAAKVVSSPQVLTLSNVEAVFDNSQSFYVRVAGRDEVDLFNVSAGTTLRVTPHVFKDRDEVRIKMLVAVEDGSLSTRTVDTLPVVNRSSINTQAMIFEGESLLVGGITRQSNSDAESKVPLLGDIPFLGALFRNKNTSSERVERMFLISPRLAATRRPSVVKAAAAVEPAPTPAPAPAPAHVPADAAAAPSVSAKAQPAAAPPLPRSLKLQDRRGPRDGYGRGEPYEIEVEASMSTHLYCYLLDESQQLHQFFPNATTKSATLAAGSVLQFPGPFGFRLTAGRRSGQETVACFGSEKDLGPSPVGSALAKDVASLKAQFARLAGSTFQMESLDIKVP